jgi:dienelactone hydrolase
MKFEMTLRVFGRSSFSILIATFISSGDARAASIEHARAQCHDRFVPVVRSCVRKKWTESGGSPSQYIAGCREAVMPQARACVAQLLGANKEGDENTSAEIEIAPPSEKGRVVLILSGIDGTAPYKEYAERIAKLGYYAVVIDGRDILSADQKGGDRLQKAITKALDSSNAIPGKIGVIGFSAGGGGALAYAERQPDAVSTIIAYYPATSFIAKVTDMKTFVGKFQVPLLVFAAGKDEFNDCCLLTTAKEMATNAKELAKPIEFLVYPDAGHNFIKGSAYRADDAEDAWKRTVDKLHQYLN